jgi:xylulose-5-phosphate/fructose-6-phosphate phosphoketolase
VPTDDHLATDGRVVEMRDKLIEHRQYITTYGEDMPAIRDLSW